MLDAVIATIRGSDDRPAARTALMAEPFSFTEVQADPHPRHDARPPDPAGPHRARGGDGQAAARPSPSSRRSWPTTASCAASSTTEMTAIRDKYANPRRSIITHDPGELGVEDLIDDEEIVVTMTRAGYIKSVAAAAFRTQGRGGRGVQGARLKEEDLVTQVVHTTAHAYLLLFSNQGKVYRLRGHEIPMKERTARGHGGGQPGAAGAERVDPGHHRHAGVLAGPVPASSPPRRARSRRRRSASTTSPAARASSPSTCARATSWCGSWPRRATTTSSR